MLIFTYKTGVLPSSIHPAVMNVPATLGKESGLVGHQTGQTVHEAWDIVTILLGQSGDKPEDQTESQLTLHQNISVSVF